MLVKKILGHMAMKNMGESVGISEGSKLQKIHGEAPHDAMMNESWNELRQLNVIFQFSSTLACRE